MLCGDKYDIVLSTVDGQVRNPQRLRVNRAISVAREQLAKHGAAHKRRCKGVFLGICTVPREIIVIGVDPR